MSLTYDAIIIGGGHNGLVAAATVAQAGYKVLVLERRAVLGGAAATEELVPGFRFSTGAPDAGLLRPEVVKALNLQKFGLGLIESAVAAFAPQPDGSGLTLWRDLDRTVRDLVARSPRDAERLAAFSRLLGRLTSILHSTMLLTPPDLADLAIDGRGLGGRSPADLLPWLNVALKLKGLGRADMMEMLRVLPMSVDEFMGEWFESDALKGLIGSAGITGTLAGPRGAGTAFMLLYQSLGAPGGVFKASRFVLGGTGQLAAALAAAALQFGADIRTGAEVERIRTENGRATGVVLRNGDEFAGRAVVSGTDPRRTLLDLVGATQLDPEIVRLARNIRFRGCVAKVNLALAGLPRFTGQGPGDSQLSGHIVVAPSLDYLERAYDDAKYGNYSRDPYLDVVIPSLLDPALAPSGQHVLSITMQYAPDRLREGTWAERREELGNRIVDTLARYAPGLKDLILFRQVLTPEDWHSEYSLTNGDIFHGQMGLDQLLFMRPIAGYSQYRMPIEHLYLCSSGTHPGGGVTGAPGYNAAREVLRDLKRARQ